jgi:hypothetical protein
MSLKIIKIDKDGDQNKEFILMEATANINLSSYAIVDRTYNPDGTVSNVHRHFYRFPAKNVEKGDFVAITTGKGNNRTTDANGTPIHRFFWGAEAPFWNDDQVERAEVLKVETVSGMVV